MRFRKITFIKFCSFISLFCSSNLWAQQVTSVIPYELYAGKMIIKMSINGQIERFIFDTGAGKSSLSAEFCSKNKFIARDSIKINDATGNASYYPLTQIDSIATLDGKVKFKGLNAAIMPVPSPIRCYDAVGFIGSDLLSETICTIDSKSKTITISAAENPITESFRYAHEFAKEGSLPIVNTYVNGQKLTVLFDSGSGSFMNLKQSDFETLKANANSKLIKEGIGNKSFGISGTIQKSINYQALVPELRIGPMKFINIVTETGNSPYTLLGVAFMEYAKITIDYHKKRLYCVPYEQGTITPQVKQRNFSITVTNGQLTVAHIWKDLAGQIAEGDVITHINGIKTGTYDFCDTTSGIEELKEPGSKMMTIQTKDNRTVNIAYKVEEINNP